MSAARKKARPTAAQKQAAEVAKSAFKGASKMAPGGIFGKSRRSIVAILVGILAVQIVSPATVILLIAGMLPSVVAYLVDTEPGKRSAHCMSVLNMAGVLPVLAILWQRGATRGAAADILMDPFMWFLMYGAAGIAVLLLTLLPVLMEQMSNAAAERETSRLEKRMEELVEEWGSDLAHEAGKLDPGSPAQSENESSSGRPGANTAGGAASSRKGAAQGPRPSSPSAASQKPALRSDAPARG